MHEAEKFYALLSLVCRKMPHYTVQMTLDAGEYKGQPRQFLLIGAAGAQLVIPNWMYADPKQANLMGFLEAQSASRGHAFATGDSTTSSSVVLATDSRDVMGAMLDVLERLDQSNRDFRDEITDWQRSFEVKLDPCKAKRPST